MISRKEGQCRCSDLGGQMRPRSASQTQPRKPPLDLPEVEEVPRTWSSQVQLPLQESLAEGLDLSRLLPYLLSSREPPLENGEQNGPSPSDGDATQPTALLNAAERLEELASSFRKRADAILVRARESINNGARHSGAKTKQKPTRRRVDSKHLAGNGVVVSPKNSYFGPADPSQGIKSPTTSLEGLYAKFLDTYLARNQRGDTVTVVLSFVRVVPDVLPSPVSALEDAARTLVLVSLGGATGDQGLLQQAVKHYGKALIGLRRSIAHPQMLHYEHTFVAITILLMCSYHAAIRTVDSGWVQHMWGAQQLFVARNSECFQTEVGTLAFVLARHASLSYSLLARKKSIFAKYPPARTPSQSGGSSWANMLLGTAIHIPTLLERHDAIMLSEQTDRACVEALEADCVDIESRLRTWHSEWATMCATQGIRLFKEQDIECFSSFSSLCQDRTFSTAYSFSNFYYIFLGLFYCISLHQIIETRGSLAALLRKLTPDATNTSRNETIATFQSEADILAQDICMCLPFLCEDQCGIGGDVAIFLPLRIVTTYFQKQGDEDRLRWTDEVRRTVFVKGVTPPNVSYQRRT